MIKVYVDGQAGTTGLKINERLQQRQDIQILRIDEDKRKDSAERKKYLNDADIVFLCLPDAASIEAVSMIENDTTKVIDASTAHRTLDNWVYGIPELSKEQREKIKHGKRIAVPGCYATGFNMMLHPLVKEGIVPADYPITCHAVSGYSGGGNQLIHEVESPETASKYASPSMYALGLTHKHLPEMQKISGLLNPPLFTPIVANYYQGMTVAVPLYGTHLKKVVQPSQINEFLKDYYSDSQFVKVMPYGAEDTMEKGFLTATNCNGTNNLEIFTFGNEQHMLLTARLDNLGKGASGAAIQNMNIMMGVEESIGL